MTELPPDSPSSAVGLERHRTTASGVSAAGFSARGVEERNLGAQEGGVIVYEVKARTDRKL